MAELVALQRRFQALVVAGHGDLAGLLGGGELGIYAHAYGARLHDVLAVDHPVLKAALGDEGFAALAAGYLAACPPSSYTVRDVGLRLAEHLAADGAAPPWAAALARLERARVEVFDGPDADTLGRDAVAALAPDELPGLRLRWVPASALVGLGWSVDDGWSEVEDGRAWPPPGPVERTVLVWRRDEEVVHRALAPDEALVAPALVDGASFAEVCERLLACHDDGEAVAARAIELLVGWLDAGALRAA